MMNRIARALFIASLLMAAAAPRIIAQDCNGNGIPGPCDIACGPPGGPCDVPGCGQSDDCNGNGLPDECDVADPGNCCLVHASAGCTNPLIEACICGGADPFCCAVSWDSLCVEEVESLGCGSCDPLPDCNANAVPDECDLADGTSPDCQANGIPDECEIVLGFFDAFPTTMLDPSKWCANSGATVDTVGTNEPSPPYSLHLNSVDSIEGCTFDLSNAQSVTLGYWFEQTGNGAAPGSGDDLFTEYLDSNGVWVVLAQYLGSGPNMVNYQQAVFDAPTAALHSGFRFRFRATGDPGADDWLIDDVELTVTGGDCNGNGILDECEIAEGASVDVVGEGAEADGIPDECQGDCNGNLIPDANDLADGNGQDCNDNDVPDECDIASGASLDDLPVGGDGIPDECQEDCNANLIPDAIDIASSASQDCNFNHVPDECDIAGGPSQDCQPNGIPDECETDCNANGISDECDIASGASQDCQPNGIPDECETDCNANGVPDDCDVAGGASQDCQPNGIPDECEVDCNNNDIPDECDIPDGASQDCQPNGIPDECELLPVSLFFDEFPTTTLDPTKWCANSGAAVDFIGLNEPSPPFSLRLNGTDVIESCTLDLSLDQSATLSYWFQQGSSPGPGDDLLAEYLDGEGAWIVLTQHFGSGPSMVSFQQEVLELPIDALHSGFRFRFRTTGDPFFDDWFIDDVGLTALGALDCNGNSIPDACDIADNVSVDLVGDDAQADGIPDECQSDCNGNLIPDELDIAVAASLDCNANGVPDECDIADGSSQDCQPNGIPDLCEFVSGLIDDFPTTMLDPSKWCANNGATVDTVGSNEPSPPLSLRLNGVDSIESCTIDLSTLRSATFSYWYERRGNGDSPESGDDLLAEYLADDGVWVVLAQHLGNGPDMFNYVQEVIDLPVEALHSGFRLRFRTTSDPGSDDWFIDDVELTVLDVDCNGNGILDECDIAGGGSADAIGAGGLADGIPDECQHDCNVNLIPDEVDIASAASLDCNANGVPDECDIDDGMSEDCQSNGIPDECETDCNSNDIPDDCDIANGPSQDCQPNGVPDECDIVFGFFDQFPAITLDSFKWCVNDEAAIDGIGANEPSPPYSLHLNEADSIESCSFDLSNAQAATLAYWFEHTGNGAAPVTGDDLFAEYLDDHDAWVVLAQHLGSGPSMASFQAAAFNLPPEALHSGFRFRFRATGDPGSDDWFIDDVELTVIGTSQDCNANGIPDECDIASSGSIDNLPVGGDGIPDECQEDCNANFIPDECEIVSGFVDEFPTTTLDPFNWCANNGATVDGLGANEPSPPFSLHLNGADSIQSCTFDLSNAQSARLSYWFEQSGFGVSPGAGDDLFAEYLDTSGAWVVLAHYLGSGPDMLIFQQAVFDLPAEALHSDFRFRFRATGDPVLDDDWFIDDVELTVTGPSQDCNANGVPDECDVADGASHDCQPNGIPDECDLVTGFADEFPTTLLVQYKWCLFNGATVDGIGVSEPSPPFSLHLNFIDSIESCTIDLSTAQSARLSYWFEATGNGSSRDPGDDLFAEYLRSNGAWVALAHYLGSGPNMVNYQQDVFDLPAEALHSGFRLRFRVTGDPGSDDWFVDNVELTMTGVDCNGNGLLDDCDIADGASADVVGGGAQADGIPDECQIDCNGNLLPDGLDIAGGISLDCNVNGIPDECETDCNDNGVPDDCDLNLLDPDGNGQVSEDANDNGIPDECENQPPLCDAGGPYVAACDGPVTAIALDGTASSDPDADELAYLWSTTCPGGVFDEPTSPTPILTVETDPGCLIECGVTLVVDDGNGASDTCSASVAISDMTPPQPACPADASVECGGDTSPAATGMATAIDECSAATVTSIDTSTPGCGGTETITRTWTATDACGNAASCDQTITVTDTTSPEITCPADVTLECPAADTSPATTGMATATDECSTATITFSDTSTPGCGGTETITRTWTATDDCGNSATCDQLITVIDTMPPEIACPDDLTLVWGDATDPSATGMATASDDCDPAAPAIAHIDVVTEPVCLADPVQATITRTWTATDACGNAASCDQTLTLLKRTASLIIKQGACPAPLNRESHGVLPALVTGDTDFDVTQINASTVRLSRADCVGGSIAPNTGPPGPPILVQDLNHPYVGPPPCSCNADQTPDGLDDLALKFRVDDLVEALELDSLPDGALVELCVTGTLADGCQFRACDCVRLIAPGTPEALVSVTSNVSGAWVDVSPLDNTLDGGGFTDFVRNFPETTVVTLSAETFVNNKPLVGWMIDGQFIAANGAAPWLPGTTLKHTLIAGQAASIEVVYGPPVKKSVPQPGPNIGPAGSSGFKTSGKP